MTSRAQAGNMAIGVADACLWLLIAVFLPAAAERPDIKCDQQPSDVATRSLRDDGVVIYCVLVNFNYTNSTYVSWSFISRSSAGDSVVVLRDGERKFFYRALRNDQFAALNIGRITANTLIYPSYNVTVMHEDVPVITTKFSLGTVKKPSVECIQAPEVWKMELGESGTIFCRFVNYNYTNSTYVIWSFFSLSSAGDDIVVLRGGERKYHYQALRGDQFPTLNVERITADILFYGTYNVTVMQDDMPVVKKTGYLRIFDWETYFKTAVGNLSSFEDSDSELTVPTTSLTSQTFQDYNTSQGSTLPPPSNASDNSTGIKSAQGDHASGASSSYLSHAALSILLLLALLAAS